MANSFSTHIILRCFLTQFANTSKQQYYHSNFRFLDELFVSKLIQKDSKYNAGCLEKGANKVGRIVDLIMIDLILYLNYWNNYINQSQTLHKNINLGATGSDMDN